MARTDVSWIAAILHRIASRTRWEEQEHEHEQEEEEEEEEEEEQEQSEVESGGCGRVSGRTPSVLENVPLGTPYGGHREWRRDWNAPFP